MGMDYIPVYAEGSSSSSVPGQGTVTLSEERRQQIGMESAPVKRRDLGVIVRATGQVAYDPDLYHAISEYSEAVKAREAVKNSPYPDVLQRSDALVQASDMRLRQMGLAEHQIREIEKSTQPPTNLLFGSPGGTVWVYAQVYEYEIPLVKPGQRVELTTESYPGRKFHGVVKSLDPIVSAETRSLRVRIEVPNHDGLLSLQMYVNADIRADIGRKLAIPTSALVDTGTRKIVFVDLGNGRLEPHEVEVGRQAEGYYEVLSGIKEGEKVVTAANFLIDSESKLKATTPDPGKTQPHEHKH
jgi:Cu(I)/Ag(I) efflux system membrane fusion protein